LNFSTILNVKKCYFKYDIKNWEKVLTQDGLARKADIPCSIVLLPIFLEGGTDLRYIQELLEHKSSKTTEICTHVIQHDIGRIKSPLDFGVK